MLDDRSGPLVRLKQLFEKLLGQPVSIKLNRNRHTMLSVLKSSPAHKHLSVHEMFLEAPYEVLQDAAAFIRAPKSHRAQKVRFYIQNCLADQLPKPRLKSPLTPQGKHHDLDKQWQLVRTRYLPEGFDAKLTWFGNHRPRSRKRLILGMYDYVHDLIKIHRILDGPDVPDYYLRYVLYLEELHLLYPPFVDDKGVLKQHHATFKYHEKRFEEYTLAREWERSQKQIWFAA